MLKVLLPFVLGIIAADRIALPGWFVAAVLLACGSAALLSRRGGWLVPTLLAAGYGAVLLQPPAVVPPLQRPVTLEIRIDEASDLRGAALGTVTAWRDPDRGRLHPARARIRLYAASLRLGEGDRILCHTTIRPFAGGSLSFRRLMRRRGVVGSCRIAERDLVECLPAERRGLHRLASEALASRFAAPRDSLGREAAALVRAMTVGDRRALSPALRQAYARSGMAHLLAVSGLHAGIVYLFATLLFGWLSLRHGGHRRRNFLVIVLLWLYVAAAGFPPGAVRAAVMCSLLQLGLAFSSPYRAANAWATAALLLLLVRPAWLGDIGFQLSFVAVAAILFWSVPLARRCRTGLRLVDRPLQALAIGLSASVATAPLVSHAFGIVPLAGVVLNPIVAVTGLLVVGGGLLTLLLPPSGGLLLPVTLRVAAWQNELAARVAAFDDGVLEGRLPAAAVAGIYLLFVVGTVAARSYETKKSVHLPA